MKDEAGDIDRAAGFWTGGNPLRAGELLFERLPLENFGNRIPQLSFEVMRPIGRLERMTRAVTLIPGTTEFGYEPATIVQIVGPGHSAPENRQPCRS